MSEDQGWATDSVKGSSVMAGSMVVAVTVLLCWSQMTVVAGPSAATRLSQWLAQRHYTSNGSYTIGVSNSLRARDDLPPFQNITGKVIEELASSGRCYEQRTNSTKVIGVSNDVKVLTLSTNVVHTLWLQSYTAAGERRCAGGDYYELDLSSTLWKSRPRIEDLRNGTYEVQFMVPDAYAGSFNFSAYLLFDAYHGLDFDGQAFKIVELTAFLHIHFVNGSAANIGQANYSVIANVTQQRPTTEADNLLTLKRCDAASDFRTHEWSGRWTRPVNNDRSCTPDERSRYAHCFPDNISCINPSYCSGNISSLESIGWSYSAHCAFHIFTPQEAWDCLSGRWLFFWGDSNHQDTIRNLLTFILQIEPPPGRDLLHFPVDRSFQNWYRNPTNLNQELRITSHFNGHPMVDGDGIGIDSLQNPKYRDYITKFFQAHRYPDTVIMNSGLHDGLRFHTIPDYLTSINHALTFWTDLFRNLNPKPPNLLYRTTVAPAGDSRGKQSNPHKMEIFNRIMTENIHARFPDAKFVDAFDMSFPFHYDNLYSDGGHYGRPPGGENHHFYFVDIMLGHVLLNALCSQSPS